MAPKAPTTPKAKLTRATKGSIAKRTPTKAASTNISPAKTSSTKASPVRPGTNKAAAGPPLDKDLVFLWKCVKMSTGMKIDWAAISKDAGKSVGTVHKQYWRLNNKVEKYFAATAPTIPNAEASTDASDDENDNSEKVLHTVESNGTE